MSEIQKAERTLSDLQAKRARLSARGVGIGNERANIAYQAHTAGDAKTEKRLAELHREAAEYESQIAGLDAAIKTASEKLAQAKQDEASRADREVAKQLRKTVAEFSAAAELADARAMEFIAACQALEEAGAAMSSQGLPPSGQQRISFFSRAVFTFLLNLPAAWRRQGDFPVLMHNERRTFSGPAR
jgi:chromosome segregation ATPase